MSLRVDLSGNQSGFQAMLNQARTQAKAFSNAVTHEVGNSWSMVGKQFAASLAGLASLQGLKSGLDWFVSTGKDIKEMSEQINMGTDAWQRWADAADRAGLSTTGLQRVIEALQEKRNAALLDPKARGELNRLGFSDADITGNMDMSEFTRRALQNANGGAEQRGYLANVIGQRGLKYANTLNELPNAQAQFSPEDLKQSDELAKDYKDLGKAAGTATVGLVRFFTGQQEYQGKVIGFWAGLVSKYGKYAGLGGRVAAYMAGKVEETDPEAAGKREDYFKNGYTPVVFHRNPNAAPPTGPDGKPTGTAPTPDPMDDKLAQQAAELALKEQTRQQSILDRQRGMMTIGNRCASIMGELPKLQAEIAQRNAKMKGEDFLTAAQKKELEGVTGKARQFAVNDLRSKYQDVTDEKQLRAEGLQQSLKEKPLSFQADSLAKVGLYSASALNFNPLLGIGQQQVQLLKQLVVNTKPGHPTAKVTVRNSFGDPIGAKVPGTFHPGGGDTGGHGAGGTW